MISVRAMRAARRSPSGIRGFSIIELLVAVALTLMLLGGVIAIFVSARVSSATTDRLSQMQESGRLALDGLTFDIRSAGFSGCAREPAFVSTSLENAGDLKWNFLDSPVRGYQNVGPGAWIPALDTGNIPHAAEDSDVLVLRGPRRNANPLRLQADMEHGRDALVTPKEATSSLKAGDVAMAYSCEAQAYFYVSSIVDGTIMHTASRAPGGAPGNAVDTIGYAFRADAEVAPVQTVIYYVRANARGVRSLWRRAGQDEPQEIVEGIEQMQLQFGLGSAADGSIDGYLTADAVSDWNAVNSVAIALLVRSDDSSAAVSGPDAYQLLDAVIPSVGDRRMREVFTAVAGFRNRTAVR